MLADDRLLTNFGRYQMRQEAKGGVDMELKLEEEFIAKVVHNVLGKIETLREHVDVLVVFDGKTPPLKEAVVKARAEERKQFAEQRDGVDPSLSADDRARANRRGGAFGKQKKVFAAILGELRRNNIPFLVAPYEADSQLAYLQRCGYTDVSITDDTDVLAYEGATPVVYKLDGTAGIALSHVDLSADGDLYLLDMSKEHLAAVFCAAGTDYETSLQNIGIKTAVEEVRAAFFPPKASDKHSLDKLIDQLMYLSTDNRTNDAAFQESYRRKFCSALLMFRHATVYDPFHKTCVDAGTDLPDALFGTHGLYESLRASELDSIVGSHLPLSRYIAAGWIDPRTMTPREGMKLPPEVQEAYDAHLRDQKQAQAAAAVVAATEALRGDVNDPETQDKRSAFPQEMPAAKRPHREAMET